VERHCPMLLLALGRRLLAGRNHAELGAQQDHLFLQFPCSHPLHRAAEFVDGVLTQADDTVLQPTRSGKSSCEQVQTALEGYRGGFGSIVGLFGTNCGNARA